MPATLLMRRIGHHLRFVSGLLVYALGFLLFRPAALVTRYSFFLPALFIITAELAFFQIGAASFIAQLGEPATPERRRQVR